MKYKQGYLISTGNPKNEYIDHSIRHVFFKQGIIGIQVKILIPTDFTGKLGGIPKNMPDRVNIRDPKPIVNDDIIPVNDE